MLYSRHNPYSLLVFIAFQFPIRWSLATGTRFSGDFRTFHSRFRTFRQFSRCVCASSAVRFFFRFVLFPLSTDHTSSPHMRTGTHTNRRCSRSYIHSCSNKSQFRHKLTACLFNSFYFKYFVANSAYPPIFTL